MWCEDLPGRHPMSCQRGFRRAHGLEITQVAPGVFEISENASAEKEPSADLIAAQAGSALRYRMGIRIFNRRDDGLTSRPVV